MALLLDEADLFFSGESQVVPVTDICAIEPLIRGVGGRMTTFRYNQSLDYDDDVVKFEDIRGARTVELM